MGKLYMKFVKESSMQLRILDLEKLEVWVPRKRGPLLLRAVTVLRSVCIYHMVVLERSSGSRLFVPSSRCWPIPCVLPVHVFLVKTERATFWSGHHHN